MQWDDKLAKLLISRLIAKKMLAVGELLRDTHRLDLSVPYPPASKPREYPHRRTGKMILSVTVSPSTPEMVMQTKVVQVSYHPDVADYPPHLKKIGRLAIADTKERIRGQLIARFKEVTDD